LQTLANATALAAARELNGTAAGISNAISAAASAADNFTTSTTVADPVVGRRPALAARPAWR
jgi:hypothetical protein